MSFDLVKGKENDKWDIFFAYKTQNSFDIYFISTKQNLHFRIEISPLKLVQILF